MKLKRFTTFGLLACLSVALPMLSGCQTITDTPGQNANRISRTTSTDWREAGDDTEHVLLLDRPLTLSEAPIPP